MARRRPKLHRQYDDRTGRMVAEGRMKRGKRDGCWIHWYPSGECRALGIYREDDESGLWSYWYKNGQKAAEGVYEEGVEEGTWSYWYENGVMKASGGYKLGEVHGRWMRRDMSGELECVEDWNEGVLVRRLSVLAGEGD